MTHPLPNSQVEGVSGLVVDAALTTTSHASRPFSAFHGYAKSCLAEIPGQEARPHPLISDDSGCKKKRKKKKLMLSMGNKGDTGVESDFVAL